MSKVVLAVLTILGSPLPVHGAARHPSEAARDTVTKPTTPTDYIRLLGRERERLFQRNGIAAKPEPYDSIIARIKTLATGYAARFRLEDLPSKELGSLARLYLESGQPDRALEAANRRVATASTSIERAAALVALLNFIRGDLDLAERAVAGLDSLGVETASHRIDGHRRLMSREWNDDRSTSIARIRSHAERVFAIDGALPLEARRMVASKVAAAYQQLATTYRLRGDDLAADSIWNRGMAQMRSIGRDMGRALFAMSLIGSNSPVLIASYWVNPHDDRPRYDPKGKVTLLAIVDVWCQPCRDALPAIKRTYEKYRGQGLEIIVATQLGGTPLPDSLGGVRTELDAVRQFFAGEGLTMPIAIDSAPGWRTGDPRGEPRAERRVVEHFASDVNPSFFVIDRAGVVRARFVGSDETAINELIESLL